MKTPRAIGHHYHDFNKHAHTQVSEFRRVRKWPRLRWDLARDPLARACPTTPRGTRGKVDKLSEFVRILYNHYRRMYHFRRRRRNLAGLAEVGSSKKRPPHGNLIVAGTLRPGGDGAGAEQCTYSCLIVLNRCARYDIPIASRRVFVFVCVCVDV